MADQSFLDWPFFEAVHRKLAVELNEWAEQVLSKLDLSHKEGADLDASVCHLVTLLGEAGLLQLSVPGAYGGRSPALDVRSLCLAREILARHTGLADFAFAMQGLGSAPVSLFGSEEQRQHYLPEIAAGRMISAFALSEDSAGSDVAGMSTQAVSDGDGYRLTGSKTWISNAGLADIYTVFARLNGVPGVKGLVAFAVPADTPGLDASERIEVIAPHPLGKVKFNDCRLPASALIGQPGDGFKIAMATLDVFRSTVGAAALGFARRALDEALDRSMERQVFGKPLADYQLTQAKIAEMALDIDAAALLIYRAGWVKDSGSERVTREASMAKLYATESAQQVIDKAVQLFGGLGVVRGVAVEELYREIRALRIYEGTSEIQKLVIATKIYQEWEAKQRV